MYSDVSSKKLLLLFGVICVLIVSVAFTFFLKSSMYGVSSFSQVVGFVSSNIYHTVLYTVRESGTSGLVAATTSTYQNTDAVRRASAIPVLTYHAIVEAPDDLVSPESFEGHNVSLKSFEDQMFVLKKAGWQTITMEDFAAFLNGTKELPERSFLLTFDDGAKQSYYPVDPILRALGYNAVSFILPAYSQGEGSYYYLSQGEIDRMVKSGRWEIESHGEHIHTFANIDANGDSAASLANELWLPDQNRNETLAEYTDRVDTDLATAKADLEKMTSEPITAFAFPFGDFGQLSKNNPDAQAVIRQAVTDNYDFGFYQWWPGEGFTYNYSPKKLYVKRISVQPSWTGAELLQFLGSGMPKDLPYEDTFDDNKGWISTWGNFLIDQNDLYLAADPDSTGASVILDGSGQWQNYKVHMELESPHQTSVYVWARFTDNNNNVACNIANGFSHVEQTVDGTSRVVKGGDTNVVIPKGIFSVDMVVNGRTASCYMNGQELVSSDFIDPSLQQGGIGVKSWDKTNGNSVTIIHSVTVTPITSTDNANTDTADTSPAASTAAS